MKPLSDRFGEFSAGRLPCGAPASICDYGRQPAGASPNPLRLDALADSVDQMIWSARPDGYTDYYNARWFDFTGAAGIGADGEAWRHLIHPDDLPRTWRTWKASLRTGEAFEIEFRLRHRTGVYRWVVGRARAALDERGELIRWYGSCTDVHDLKTAQEELARREAQLRTILETVPVGIVMAEFPSGRIVEGNACVERMLRHPLLLSPNVDAYGDWLAFHEDGSRVQPHEYPLARLLEGEEAPELEALYERGDGTKAWTRVMARPVKDMAGDLVGGVAAFIDIDGKRRTHAALREVNETLEHRVAQRNAQLLEAQEALRQSRKLDAMGQITGGVAHDFNNLLTPILGGLDMLHRRGVGGGDERIERILTGMIASAERAKSLVQRLLAFARRQPLNATAVNLCDLTSDLRQILATTLSSRIRLLIEVPQSLPYVHADVNQLELAILNLAVNARDAMPDGGDLRIGAELVSIEQDQDAGLAPGFYVRVTVSDTGAGMDAETRKRAVEPFFTTKGVGHGAGLGLSMVHGLVAQLGGALSIESEPGAGAAIHLLLPTANSPFVDAPDTEAALDQIAPGRVLLAEDEEAVRTSIAHMLESFGQEVTQAASAEEALARLESGETFDLVVTDHLMPGMSGVALAKHIQTLWPDQKVLIVSGYADLDDIAPEIPRLTKPFRYAEVARILPTVLPQPKKG